MTGQSEASEMTEQTENQEDLPIVATADNVEVLQIFPSADESQSSDSPWLAVPVSAINAADLENLSQNQDPSMCQLCQNRRFQDSTSSMQDKLLLTPCACNFHAHHGCLVDLVETQEKCLVCGVDYRSYKYGSKADFFVKYWYRFAIFASTCLVLFGCGLYGIFLTCPPTELSAFLLLVPSCAAVIIGSQVGYHYMDWMFNEGFVEFQQKYRSITVFNYKPEISAPAPVVIDEEITPLDDVDGSNLINLDMTAKQNQAKEKLRTCAIMASTPCVTNETPVKFSFDTPKHDSPV